MGNPSCFLYLVDAASSRRYLVDSRSAFSLIPHKSAAAPTGSRLITAHGTPLKCWGRRTCTVHTRTKKFTWSFLLAPVAFPIIGADFLCSFKLMVDVSNKRLVSRGGQLTQLVLGKHTSAAVVTGVMATPRCRRWSPQHLLVPQWRHYPLHLHPAATVQDTSSQPARRSGQEARRG